MMFGQNDFWDVFLEKHSSEMIVLVLFGMVVVTLIIIVPQLLRAHLRKVEILHEEHMRSLEVGIPLPYTDESSKAAGRTTMLVPMVVIITAGTVTCFLVAYKSEFLFSVVLAVWVISGVVSLAAITGGVALIGRLAQLHSEEEEEVPSNPLG